MKYPAPKIEIEGKKYDIITPQEFNKRLGIDVTTMTISYQIKKGKLDYTTIGVNRFIIWNQKAKDFKPYSRN